MAQREIQDAHPDIAPFYQKKGERASGGKSVMPEKVEDERIPEHLLPMLRKAHASLMELLTTRMIEAFPEETAALQARFDCWVFEQEYAQRTSRIYDCREGFYNMRDVLYTSGMKSGLVTSVFAVDQPSMMVYFKPNSVSLSGYTLQHIKVFAKNLKKVESYDITLNAYSGKDEPDTGKVTLAQRRALAVKNALMDEGVNPDAIAVFVFSKSEQMKDKDRNYENRSVEMILDIQQPSLP